jgi:L-threonylcarbamoyladenylate synthase
VTLDELRRVAPDTAVVTLDAVLDHAQIAPGQLLRHYAPSAPMTVFAGTTAEVVRRLAAESRTHAAAGRRVGVLAPDEDLVALAPELAAAAAHGRVVVASLGRRGDPEEAARRLFAALRTLDADGVEVIVASGPEQHGLGAAVWDRLRRAAEGRVVPV